jgi:hypothetical protein
MEDESSFHALRVRQNAMNRTLRTAKGEIPLPIFFPVTTFGCSFQLDELFRPHLERFFPAVLASLHYTRRLESAWHSPLFIAPVDSRR